MTDSNTLDYLTALMAEKLTDVSTKLTDGEYKELIETVGKIRGLLRGSLAGGRFQQHVIFEATYLKPRLEVSVPMGLHYLEYNNEKIILDRPAIEYEGLADGDIQAIDLHQPDSPREYLRLTDEDETGALGDAVINDARVAVCSFPLCGVREICRY